MRVDAWDGTDCEPLRAVEADIARSQIAESQVTYSNEGSTGNFTDNLGRARQYEAVQKSSLDWLATVRGRIGYTFNNRLMIYGTGGVAFVRHNEERKQMIGARIGAGQTPPTITTDSFLENASLTRTGFVIGGGAEYDLGNSWSLKGEYLLARFGEKEFVFPNAKAGVMIASNRPYPITSTVTDGRKLLSKVDIPMIKVGLNYRF